MMLDDPYLKDLLVTSNQQIAVYIHLPWCIKKCPYCDFNSHPLSNSSNVQEYTSAILDDIAMTDLSSYKEISSIFFGGGTPSLFPGNELARIIQALEHKFGFSHDIEITIEANPNSSDQQKFSDYKSIGINRLSIGAQSFNQKNLNTLGRVHIADDSIQAFAAARQAGFSNINIDIMHGLPEQSLSEAISDLNRAIALEPEHISWYQLTIEPNTAFAANPPDLPDHDSRAIIQDQGQDLLANNAYHRLEISAFTKPGKQSQHNLHIWSFNDYVGFGAGAHSKLKIDNKLYRQYRHYHPKKFIAASDKIANNSMISDSELLLEYLLNRARILRPICRQHIISHSKLSSSALDQAFSPAIKQGLMSSIKDDWQVTNLGLDHLNSLLSDYIVAN